MGNSRKKSPTFPFLLDSRTCGQAKIGSMNWLLTCFTWKLNRIFVGTKCWIMTTCQVIENQDVLKWYWCWNNWSCGCKNPIVFQLNSKLDIRHWPLNRKLRFASKKARRDGVIRISSTSSPLLIRDVTIFLKKVPPNVKLNIGAKEPQYWDTLPNFNHPLAVIQ